MYYKLGGGATLPLPRNEMKEELHGDRAVNINYIICFNQALKSFDT